MPPQIPHFQMHGMGQLVLPSSGGVERFPFEDRIQNIRKEEIRLTSAGKMWARETRPQAAMGQKRKRCSGLERPIRKTTCIPRLFLECGVHE